MEVEPAGPGAISPPNRDSRIWETLRELTSGLTEVKAELRQIPELIAKLRSLLVRRGPGLAKPRAKA